jgi:hypothetical protein
MSSRLQESQIWEPKSHHQERSKRHTKPTNAAPLEGSLVNLGSDSRALVPNMKRTQSVSMAMQREHLGYPPRPQSPLCCHHHHHLKAILISYFPSSSLPDSMRARCHHALRPRGGPGRRRRPDRISMKRRQSPQARRRKRRDAGERCLLPRVRVRLQHGRRSALRLGSRKSTMQSVVGRCRHDAALPEVLLSSLENQQVPTWKAGGRARRPVVKDYTALTLVLLIYHACYHAGINRHNIDLL